MSHSLNPRRASASALPPLFWVQRTDRGRLKLGGRDRQSFLQGMVSNDVGKLTPGDGCYAFMLQATGQVIGDMRVLCAADYLLLDVEPTQATFTAETLEKYLIMEKCRISDVSGEMGQFLVGGTGAAAFLAEQFGLTGTENWIEGQNAPVEVGWGTGSFVARSMLIGPPAFDVYLGQPLNADVILLQDFDQAGAVELTPGDLEVLRIQAGVPRFGVDIDGTVLAPETGQTARAISYRKGCYIGQEIVARIHARGHTNRTFVGFYLSGDENTPLPAPGTQVAAEDNASAGRITSAAFSQAAGVPLALGYIRREFAEPGTTVTVNGQTAQVEVLPFALGASR